MDYIISRKMMREMDTTKANTTVYQETHNQDNKEMEETL